MLQGEFPCNKTNTFTLGHEFSGTVVEVGSEVTNFKKGDRVSVDPNNGCKCCNFCHNGKPHFCQTGGINNTIGIYRDGGWANYALAPEEQVHKLPDSITLEQGLLDLIFYKWHVLMCFVCSCVDRTLVLLISRMGHHLPNSCWFQNFGDRSRHHR